ncbi:MAG: antitoxin VapB family protein [Candidatus Aenigmarchaeota archaeon]|nr:antitoxin VapB family protein [Candidatus Aenigmarchaeota archaeon]
MPFRTITVKEKVYAKLKRAKPTGESFSDFFERITQTRKPNLLRYAGIWSLDRSRIAAIKEEIRRNRQRRDERASK